MGSTALSTVPEWELTPENLPAILAARVKAESHRVTYDVGASTIVETWTHLSQSEWIVVIIMK